MKRYWINPYIGSSPLYGHFVNTSRLFFTATFSDPAKRSYISLYQNPVNAAAIPSSTQFWNPDLYNSVWDYTPFILRRGYWTSFPGSFPWLRGGTENTAPKPGKRPWERGWGLLRLGPAMLMFPLLIFYTLIQVLILLKFICSFRMFVKEQSLKVQLYSVNMWLNLDQ